MADTTKLKEAISGLSASIDAMLKECEELHIELAHARSQGAGPSQAELDEDASRIMSEAARLMAAKTV